MCFKKKVKQFLTKLQGFDLVNFDLCNQLFPEFSSNQYKLCTDVIGIFEDVHVTFCRQKKLMKFRPFRLRHFGDKTLQNRVEVCVINYSQSFKVRWE